MKIPITNAHFLLSLIKLFFLYKFDANWNWKVVFLCKFQIWQSVVSDQSSREILVEIWNQCVTYHLLILASLSFFIDIHLYHKNIGEWFLLRLTFCIYNYVHCIDTSTSRIVNIAKKKIIFVWYDVCKGVNMTSNIYGVS